MMNYRMCMHNDLENLTVISVYNSEMSFKPFVFLFSENVVIYALKLCNTLSSVHMAHTLHTVSVTADIKLYNY